ncbi:MAG TPA: hypothetical protein VF806_07285 [Anaerolineaceae bacterium]
MWQNINARLARNNNEWWSKLTDGVLAVIVLVLLWVMVALVVQPIRVMFGLPGLLIYVLGLLATAMFALQQSISASHSETTRIWYGIVGGFLAWSVADVTTYLGIPLMPNISGVILLIMVALIVALLWRNILPNGVRFFSLTLLLNWTERVILSLQDWLAGISPVFTLSFRVAGVLAGFFALMLFAWILFRTRRRVQRVVGALMVWFLISLVVYIFFNMPV